MKRGEPEKRKVSALVKILEGEVMLLNDTIEEALHWDSPSDVLSAINRITHKADQILQTLDIKIGE